MNYLYLHGFCSGKNSYKGSYLRQNFADIGKTLVTPDLNGDDFSRMTLSSQINIIQQVTNNTKGDITLMGSSMGAYLAVLFAQLQPRVTRLMLIAPAFHFATRYLEKLDRRALERWQQERYLAVFHYGYQEYRKLHYDIVDDARHHEQQPLDRQIPALIFHGLNDTSVDYRLSIDYMGTNKLARLMLLNSDHQMADSVSTIWQGTRQFLEL